MMKNNEKQLYNVDVIEHAPLASDRFAFGMADERITHTEKADNSKITGRCFIIDIIG